jgi:single-strand DNA-binding protein
MAWNETRLTVTGRVCTDVSTSKTTDGPTMATFRVASNERRYNRTTETWETSNTLFIRIKCFRKLAERAAATLAVGDPIVVVGRAYTNKYEFNGEHREELELEAAGIGPDLSLCTVSIERSTLVEAVAA